MADEVCDSKKKKGDKTKTSPSPVTVILKINIHCRECVSKITGAASALPVRIDPASDKLTLIGFITDPVTITEKLENKIKKKVELISPKPKKVVPEYGPEFFSEEDQSCCVT